MSPSKGSENVSGENSNSHTTSSEPDIRSSSNTISNVGEKNIVSEKEESAMTESSLENENVSLGKVHDVESVDKVNRKEDGGEEENHEYISGYRIFVIMTAITLTTFLALLDTTIVATVSFFFFLWFMKGVHAPSLGLRWSHIKIWCCSVRKMAK